MQCGLASLFCGGVRFLFSVESRFSEVSPLLFKGVFVCIIIAVMVGIAGLVYLCVFTE